MLEEQVGGDTTNRYVWSPVYVDAMILRDRATATPGTLDERVWVQQDANFNVTAITDSSGAVLERYAYDPYGSVTVMNASWSTISGSAYDWKYLHQGGRLDGVSGLYYFRNRDYSPTLERWTSLDALRYNAGDVNLYRSYFNNPQVYSDPTGLRIDPLPANASQWKQIEEDTLAYYSSAGWIDWNHADPSLAKFVLKNVRAIAEKKETGTFEVHEGGEVLKDMVNPTVKYKVICPLDPKDINGVSLGIYKDYQYKLETAQGELPWSLGTSSSFSQEDLPSDLLGFYMALNDWKRADVEKYLGYKLDLKTTKSLFRSMDGDLGAKKNKNMTWEPVNHNSGLWPPARGEGMTWPKQLSTVEEIKASSGKWSVVK